MWARWRRPFLVWGTRDCTYDRVSESQCNGWIYKSSKTTEIFIAFCLFSDVKLIGKKAKMLPRKLSRRSKDIRVRFDWTWCDLTRLDMTWLLLTLLSTVEVKYYNFIFCSFLTFARQCNVYFCCVFVGRGQTRFVNKTVKNDSFFNFFAPPEGKGLFYILKSLVCCCYWVYVFNIF